MKAMEDVVWEMRKENKALGEEINLEVKRNSEQKEMKKEINELKNNTHKFENKWEWEK